MFRPPKVDEKLNDGHMSSLDDSQESRQARFDQISRLLEEAAHDVLFSKRKAGEKLEEARRIMRQLNESSEEVHGQKRRTVEEAYKDLARGKLR